MIRGSEPGPFIRVLHRDGVQAAALGRIKRSGPKRNEIIYSGTGAEGICMCERGTAEERIKAAFSVCV